MNRFRIVLSLVLASSPVFCRADDGAASIGAGGLIAMKREVRVTMAGEVLTISLGKVKVEYEFRNDTGEDVTTGVAFPVPPYGFHDDEHSTQELAFEDFSLTVEGKPAPFAVEVRAKVKARDVTAILKRYRIDAATFGHSGEDRQQAPDIKRLSPARQAALKKAGVLNPYGGANWTVEKKYFWTQSFPAHSTLHIAHEYTPVVGFNFMEPVDFRAAKRNASKTELKADGVDKYLVDELKSVCIDEKLRGQLEAASSAPSRGLGLINYVDFILTTANTWKQPIADFTLFVERPTWKDSPKLVSFCWPGPVEQIAPNLFKATAKDLVPNHELRIGFFRDGK